MSSKLPDLDLAEEVENYQAFQETTEVEIDECPHLDIEVRQNTLRCRCGAGWSGPNIQALYKALRRE